MNIYRYNFFLFLIRYKQNPFKSSKRQRYQHFHLRTLKFVSPQGVSLSTPCNLRNETVAYFLNHKGADMAKIEFNPENDLFFVTKLQKNMKTTPILIILHGDSFSRSLF